MEFRIHKTLCNVYLLLVYLFLFTCDDCVACCCDDGDDCCTNIGFQSLGLNVRIYFSVGHRDNNVYYSKGPIFVISPPALIRTDLIAAVVRFLNFIFYLLQPERPFHRPSPTHNISVTVRIIEPLKLFINF